MNQSIMMDFEIVTFWGKFWVRKGIMKWFFSIILFWTTVMIFGTWLWEYGLILVAPVNFEIITWFGFAWMPDPAGGQDGHLNHACVLLLLTTLLLLRWQVGFSNKQPGWFFISMQAVPLRERSRSVSFSNWHWALLGRGKGQTHMTTLIILRPPACWAWKWAWKQLGHLKKKPNKQPWWLMIWIQISMQGGPLRERKKKGISFFNTGPPRQGGMIFFSSDRLEPPASWFGKKSCQKGLQGWSIEKKGGAS